MTTSRITELLQQLHGALERAPELDDGDRQLLRKLAADIQGALGQPPTATPAGLAARIGEAVMRLEVSHPDITAVLAGVSKSLADMGI